MKCSSVGPFEALHVGLPAPIGSDAFLTWLRGLSWKPSLRRWGCAAAENSSTRPSAASLAMVWFTWGSCSE